MPTLSTWGDFLATVFNSGVSVAATASLWVLGFMTAMALLNRFTAPRAESLPPPTTLPKVSLLVPARNEAHNLPVLAEHLARIEYPELEIILLDDASEDETWAGLDALVQKAHRPGQGITARALRGTALPAGWLGKNWACHQLAQSASGDVFVFCDADARPGPLAVARTVSLLERYRAGCATLMPRQILGSWAERAVIPVLLHVSLYCFVPLALIPRLAWRRLGIGNGQWLAFTRKAYAAIGGHAAVRNHVVEDIALAQRAQIHRQGLAVALAASTLEVRMYRNLREVWDGFGKNLFVLTGGRIMTAPFFFALFALIHIVPWVLPLARPTDFSLWIPPLALLLTCRLIIALELREPLRGIALQVPGSLLVPLIAARSILNFRRRRLHWKGRLLQTGSETSVASDGEVQTESQTEGRTESPTEQKSDPNPSRVLSKERA